MQELSLSDWLNQDPLPQEVRYNADTSAYIPVEFIKVKLDYLDSHWGTQNFNHFLQHIQGRDYCFGSVELIISFLELKKDANMIGSKLVQTKRIITGAANFDLQKYQPNENYAATCLSLCIVNAAKELGVFFGKNLNKEMLTVPTPAPTGIENVTVSIINKSINNLLKKM